MKSCKPIYEFIVWENCNNNCQFCFQRNNPKILNEEERIKSLNNVVEFIESGKFEKGSHLLIVGGEIFHIKSEFEQINLIEFYKKIKQYMKDGIIDLLYINTNLLYESCALLWEVLDIFVDTDFGSRIRFTTSYDLYGRFKTHDDFVRFSNNLKATRQKYPDISMVVNTILTKEVCEKLTTAEYKWDIKRAMEDWGCWINLIPYIIYDDKLTPKRSDIFDALLRVDEQIDDYLKRYIENLDLDQDKYVYTYDKNKQEFQLCKSEENKCGHSINFTRYSNKGSCYICDLKRAFNGRI